ncbi:MAG: tetratricopeptide repeat protein [Chitinophagales bacterium]
MKRIIYLYFVFLFVFGLGGFGQAGVDYDIKKPEKYENRPLGYEKTTETKFKLPRHFIQNTVTHYNYYFNANNRLNEIIARAKAMNKDDYSKLLPFYNFSLDVTASSKRDLDSIISKCTTAILIHDLRNDWVDNLYMLMGRAYFYRKVFDTAYFTFQFVNYAFSPKEEGGYDKPIASNANVEEGGNAFKVSTNEERNIFKKTFSLPPSRNESLIWQIHTFIESGMMTRAAVLIEILKRDPLFPARLKPDLEEMQALRFYKQNRYDSAAIHLSQAIEKAENKQEEARWDYLIGQLYVRSEKASLAKEYFEKAIKLTYDPVLDVYARLNAIRQNKESANGEDYIQKNIEALSKMGKREIYADYRDVIYYSAAEIELERKNRDAAKTFLLQSVHYAASGSPQKNISFLELGDLAFEEKKYAQAKNYYDSVVIVDPNSFENANLFLDKKKALDKIVAQLRIIDRQDSLQRIAGLPQDEREAYVRKLVKALRKQQGLKEEDQDGSQNFSFNSNNSAPQDMFSDNNNGEWYFYNSSVKAKGFNDFRSKWGNRPNVDNWQVTSMLSRQKLSANKSEAGQASAQDNATTQSAVNPISYEALMANLPLTDEKMKKSMDSVEHAYFLLGKSYQDGLPDYLAAIDAYDSLLVQFTNTRYREETLFNLYYCYKKINDETNAARVLQMLKQKYPDGKFVHLITDPNSVIYSEGAAKAAATKQYEKIYLAFIEGNFEQALSDKKIADSLYGEKYWTPQLLFIESVYFIHERQDSAAKIELNNIIKKFSGTAMATKAKNLLSVLNRRREIEDYLTHLNIKRAEDDTVTANASSNPIPVRKAADSLVASSLADAKSRNLALPIAGIAGKSDSSRAGLRVASLDPLRMAKIRLDSAKLSSLKKQADSVQLALKKAQHNAEEKARLQRMQDSIQIVINQIKTDSAREAERIASIKSVFAYTPSTPHAVALMLNKVDPVYINETKNAFNRYNKETYYNLPLDITNVAIDESIKLVMIRGFENSMAALDYMEKARKLAPSEIIPWLPAAKYFFLIITDQNLDILQSSKDVIEYKKFLSSYYPGKF